MSDNPTVLVVEDEGCIRALMQNLLEDMFSLPTVAAANGREAVQLAQHILPALILLDIMLPDMDGLEALRQLKSNPATSQIPIIAVTATRSETKAMDGGCIDYIQKPFDIEYFLSRVQRQLVGYFEPVKVMA